MDKEGLVLLAVSGTLFQVSPTAQATTTSVETTTSPDTPTSMPRSTSITPAPTITKPPPFTTTTPTTTTPIKTTPTTTTSTTTTPTKTTLTTTTTTTSLTLTTQTPTPTTTIRTTTNPPPTAGDTNPTTCFVCRDDLPDLCDILYVETTCHPPNNYCINQVTNLADGTKVVNRTCGNFDRCFEDWYHGSSDKDVCQNFDENQYITLDFECVYCCVQDRCNEYMKPPTDTLYENKVAPTAQSTTTSVDTSTSPETTTSRTPTTTTTPAPTTTKPQKITSTTPITTTQTTTTPTTTLTTNIRTTPAGHTIAPNPTTCFVCVDDAPDMCDILYAETTCEPPNNYCINHVTNLADGTKVVNRTCGNFDRCFEDWYHGSSDKDVCRNFDENQYITLDFECVYCCIKDRCNEFMKPPTDTLYEDKGYPMAITKTETAESTTKSTTQIKTTTLPTTTITPTQGPTTSKTTFTTTESATQSMPCLPNPCKHGGSCEDLPGTFNCFCAPGYVGKTCEEDHDECLYHGCQNGGLCTNTFGSFHCTCANGYTGSTCDVGSGCIDLPGFPCADMLKNGMCGDTNIISKCRNTCIWDLPGFPCGDMLKFGMCNGDNIKEKCKHTCGDCSSNSAISLIGK